MMTEKTDTVLPSDQPVYSDGEAIIWDFNPATILGRLEDISKWVNFSGNDALPRGF